MSKNFNKSSGNLKTPKLDDPIANFEEIPTILSTFTEDSIILPNKQKEILISAKGTKLTSFTKRNLNTNHINASIYHLLLDPFTFDNAYSNLSKNKGAFTLGVTTGNIQGYSRRHRLRMVELLRTQTYIPNPIRRKWIPKPGKTELRPLGIPTFYDRIIQEAIRGILEAVYEPVFLEFEKLHPNCTNFGFRPSKSTWDAIDQFTAYGQKTTFIIEGDIKGAYPAVNKEILINLISQRIKDKKFLNLLRKILYSGVMDEGIIEHSLIGVPQGGIVSPILFNIYMFEFDKFIANEILPEGRPFLRESKKTKSKLYQRNLYHKTVCVKNYRAERRSQLLGITPINNTVLKSLISKIKIAENILLNTPSYEDSDTITFVYTRYADDWLLGIGGTFEYSSSIKNRCELFLLNVLKMELSPTKTTITNIRKDFVPFVGFEILLRSNSRRIKITTLKMKSQSTKKTTSPLINVKRRTTNQKFLVRPNKDRIFKNIKNLGIVNLSDLYPIGKRSWAALDEFQIVQKYSSIFLGLANYYKNCDTLAPLNRLSYIFQYSCAKTLAIRKKLTMPQIFLKYGKSLRIERKFKDSEKIRFVEFKDLKTIKAEYWSKTSTRSSIYYDPFKIRTFWRTTFKLYSLCCICGKEGDIQMHHIHSLKSIKKNRKDGSNFNLILKQLNRKQAPVCSSCHNTITQGTYSGTKLSDLLFASLAAL